MTYVKKQRICIKFCFKLGKTASETHRMLKEAFGDNAVDQTQTYEWFMRQSMMKSVLDDLRPEPWPKMWQKCDRLSWKTDDERFTMFATLYCDVLRRLRENIRRKCPNKWHNSWVRHQSWQRSSSRVVRCAAVFGFYEYDSHPHPSYSPDLAPCDFFLFLKIKLKLKRRHFDTIKEIQSVSQNGMKTLTQNDFQKCFRSWKSGWNRCVNAKGDYFEGDVGELKFR